VQSVPIATKAVSLNPIQGEVYCLYTICFFRQDDGDAGDDDVSSDDNTDILSSL
jgi:hypothetical protein